MKLLTLLLLPALGLAIPALVHSAPGEDPVVLKQSPRVAMVPGSPVPVSSEGARDSGIPSWLRARVARYESKALAAEGKDPNFKTDKDVVNTARSQGMRSTCIQDVGSVAPPAGSGFSQYGPKGQDQVVVLRGDLVNVCR